MSGAMRGILLMLAVTLFSASMNAAAKHISSGVHPFEVVFFRNLFALLFVLPLLMRNGLGVFRTQRFGGHLSRASLNLINMLIFFTAVSLTPLSELVALGFTAPLFATLLSLLILKERVGIRRWSAIICGFAGAMLVLKPGFDTISSGHGLTLLAASTWAGVLLIIKSLSRTESSATIIAYMVLLMTPFSLLPALFVWQWPTMEELGWLAFMGLAGGGAQYLLAQALHEADLSVVMPFDFTKLIWISIIAFLFFGEIPALTTWLGGTLIFASGIYIARREAKLRKQPVPGASAQG
jgi:drug/metabolite transporter (DMT)-like permease